jgi:hypothetical protein
VLAQALERPHDTRWLLKCIGMAYLEMQRARHLNDETKEIIRAERRRRRRKEADTQTG